MQDNNQNSFELNDRWDGRPARLPFIATEPGTTGGTPIPPRFSRRAADRQGSAIILVIVSIVLIAILGATMVQVARFERLTDTQNNIDVVVASVLDLIAIRLGEDLVDDNGNLFNPGGTFATGGGDEPYDYPWTNPGSFGFMAEHIDGSTTPVIGGVYDDMWLASTEPNPAGTLWPHITNLNGMYLNNVGTAMQPTPVYVTAPGVDSNLSTTAGFMIDTDGDGIVDSRWAWAPIKQIAGTRYVMAVRVIDMSARLDMNVAMAQFDSNPATPNVAEGIARGDTPVELDGAFFAALYGTGGAGMTAAQAQAEWERTMSYRVSGVTTGNFPAPGMVYGDRNTSLTRQHYWYRGANRVTSSFVRHGESNLPAPPGFDYTNVYGVADAFELLQKGGLDTPATALIEQHMPLLTRDGMNESDYTGFQGSIANYFARNARINLSPFTGGGIYAKPAVPNSSDFTTLGRQVDINKASPNELAQAILDIIGAPNFALPGHLSSATAYAAQLAANLKDYSDEDNWVTPVAVGGQTYYGFEALPMISEVYVEREYVYTSATDTSGSGTGPWNINWQQNGGVVSYAIEISNPYHRPIKLNDVKLQVGGTDIGGGDLATVMATAYPDGMLPAGEVFAIYHNDPTTPPAGGVEARLAGVTNIQSVTTPWSLAGASGNGEVKLICKTDGTDDSFNTTATGGAYLNAAPYQLVEVVQPTNLYVETGATADPGGGTGILQSSAQGSADGLNALHHTTAEFLSSSQTNIKQPSSAALITAQFGTANKAGAAAAKAGIDISDQQIVHQDRPMKYVGDILQVPVFGFEGGTPAVTIADQLELSTVIGAGTRVLEQLMLPYKNASRDPGFSPIDGSSPVLNYPHSVVLMDRLTVSSPFEDGEDNNGNSVIDDVGEFVIPGRINLNTASRELLRAILPYPDASFRTTYANQVIQHRESNTQFATYGFGDNGTPGIKYTGALIDQLIPSGPGNAGGNNRAIGAANGHVDWNDYEYDAAPATAGAQDYPIDGKLYAGDNIADDREEEIMISKWLNEFASVRSDVYAAYIIVQGYPAGDFTTGPTESAKLIAIFTRANVRGAGDKAQIMAVLRLE